jgi:two-component system response regulator AtoC
MARILVVEDDENARIFVSDLLKQNGYTVIAVENLQQAYAALLVNEIELILADLRLPDGHGMQLFDYIQLEMPHIPFIVMTGDGQLPVAVNALRRGVRDFIEKPITDIQPLLRTLTQESERIALRKEVQWHRAQQNGATGVSSRSPVMQHAERILQKVAGQNVRVLIAGESGTGKEVFAQAIHKLSPRHNKPFLALNCASVPHDLFESELFGYEKGAFSGANARKLGLFEAADGGTLFLDEIPSMPEALQAKLLRVLESNALRRVGGLSDIPIDVRIVAASNRNLAQMVADGKFREDLYWRIKVVEIELPPLRKRREDVPALAAHFIQTLNRQMGRRIEGLSNAAIVALVRYNWPGNIRQLRNVIEQAMIFCDGNEIQLGDLPHEVRSVGA